MLCAVRALQTDGESQTHIIAATAVETAPELDIFYVHTLKPPDFNSTMSTTFDDNGTPLRPIKVANTEIFEFDNTWFETEFFTNYQKFLQIRNFSLRHDDILVASFPKSGI